MADIVSALSVWGIKAFSKAGEIALDKYMPKAISAVDDYISDLHVRAAAKSALKKYQLTSFDRCSHVKTVINRGEKIDLLDIFVNLEFMASSRRIDIFSLLDSVRDITKITISGTGGCGKSMVMKYIWLSFFTSGDGKIPIFVELRNLNALTTVNLRLFLSSSVFNGIKIEDAENSFVKMLNDGRFCFIFDGFDEVLDKKKSEVERQIVELSDQYNDNIFIVSTRPREHVLSWQRFTNFDVAPLRKEQAVDLVRKIEFDDEIKHKFMAAISRELYDRHESFLSIPLLVNMMLMTFSDLAEFPTRMHVFYEQAFWALFKNHDARKAWSRDQSSGLALEDFQTLLSAFCYISNRNQMTKFRQKELLDTIKEASTLSQIAVDADRYMCDLIENVCIIMQDGLDYVFIHRSFQEYFAARFIANLPESDWLDAISVLPLYFGEEVGAILYNMNTVKFDAAIAVNAIRNCRFDIDEFADWLQYISKCDDGVALTVYDTGVRKSLGMTYLNMTANLNLSVVVYYLNNCIGAGKREFIQSTYTLGPAARIAQISPSGVGFGKYVAAVMSAAREMRSGRRSERLLPTTIVTIKGRRVTLKDRSVDAPKIDFDAVTSYLGDIGYRDIYESLRKASLRACADIERRNQRQSARLRRVIRPSKPTQRDS